MNPTRSRSQTTRSCRLRRLLTATLLLCTTHMAAAQSAARSTDTLGPGYVGFSGGSTDFSRISGGTGLYAVENRDTAYSLVVGNYFLNPNMGMELGYTKFGHVSRGGGTTQAEGINVSLIGKLPVSPSINLLGKVGSTYFHTEVYSQPLSGVSQGSERGFDLSYGVGVELVINPQWSAVLQYDEHFMKFAGNSADRISTTTIGARMRF